MLSLSSRPVREMMSKDVTTVSPDTTVAQAAQLMSQNRTDCLVVTADRKPVGILTERDFVKILSAGKSINTQVKVSELVRPSLVTVTPATHFSRAFSILNTYGYKQLPVVRNGVLKGILTQQLMLQYSRNKLIYAIEENRNLERKVNYDALTGVFSKRFLERRMDEEFGRCRRYGIRTSLIFFDVDLFKKVNDTYSHDAGDCVLKMVGQLIRKNVRSMDIIARYGGEEFVVIVPSTSSPQAAMMAEKIRRVVGNHSFSYKGKRFKVTLSAGVSSFSTVKSVKQALERSDKALYYAKNHGRNMVCRFSDSTGQIQIVTQEEPVDKKNGKKPGSQKRNHKG